MRYHPILRPSLDILSSRLLRLTSRALHIQHDQNLFLLGHMRSGSSLLSAIITSSDDINGYGEAKVVYRGDDDLRTLCGKIAIVQMLNRHRPVRCSRYVFDKVLHRHLLPSSSVLKHPDSRIIFLYREPEATLRSIVGSFGWPIDKALIYLQKQYAFLEQLASEVGDPQQVVVLNHKEVIENSQAVLTSLSDWLGLDQTLKPMFDPRKISRIVGSGDTSDRLNAGKILQDQRSHPVDLTGVSTDEIFAQYEDTVAVLRSRFPSWEDITAQALAQGSSRD